MISVTFTSSKAQSGNGGVMWPGEGEDCSNPSAGAQAAMAATMAEAADGFGTAAPARPRAASWAARVAAPGRAARVALAATAGPVISVAAGNTFNSTAAAGATGYQLWLGSTGAGANSLYSSGVKTATSLTVANPPTNGETIYARLYTNFNGTWVLIDYTFTAAP